MTTKGPAACRLSPTFRRRDLGSQAPRASDDLVATQVPKRPQVALCRALIVDTLSGTESQYLECVDAAVPSQIYVASLCIVPSTRCGGIVRLFVPDAQRYCQL
jgi:hypothetical protein